MIVKPIKYLIICIILCFTLQTLRSQVKPEIRKSDSVANLIKANINDTLKMYQYFELAQKEIKEKNYALAIEYSEESLNLATQLKSEEVYLDNLMLLAYTHSLQDKLSYAIRYYLKSISILEKSNQNQKLANVFWEIGLIYQQNQLYSKAIEYYLKAYPIKIEQVLENDGAKIAENIGNCYYHLKNYDLAETYFSKAATIHKKLNQTNQYVSILSKNAQIKHKQKKYNESLSINEELYEILRNSGDIKSLMDVTNNIAYCYVLLGNYEKALITFKQTMLTDQQLQDDDEKKANMLVNIGVCYQNIGDIQNSVKHLTEAINIRKKQKNWKEVAIIENIIASLYYEKNDLYNADLYCQQSIDNAKKSVNKETLQLCYRTYAKILQAMEEDQKALEYYQLYLNIRDSLLIELRLKDQKLSDQEFELEKAEKELKLKLADEELKDLALKQLQLEAEKQQQKIELQKKENDLLELQKQRAEQALALARQQHEAAIRDKQITSLEKEKAIKDLELKQKEVEEKERQKEIASLQHEKEKQKLELEKQALEKRRMLSIALLFGIIFILILILFIWVGKKNKILAKQKIEIEDKNKDLHHKNEEITQQKENLQQKNEEITTMNEELQQKNEEILSINEALQVQKEEIIQQKDIIEKKNRDITDSIQYAKRIQKAIFPPIELLKEQDIDQFIFFKPRDIVSGDFYWFTTLRDRFIIAAADCTGHGVPGAFMSMLGLSLLEKIVHEMEIDQPGFILTEMRKQVKNSMHQTGKLIESKDGMDMALCSINFEQKYLEFAGANNPLYLIRHYNQNETDQIIEDKTFPILETNNGILQLIEYKADKMPIGIHLREKDSFTNYKIDYKKGDTAYIFSDGFIDQFGGKDGRKFLAKYFKELLLKINYLPLQQQRKAIESTYFEWLGNKYEQLDDILIIGIKLK